MLAMVTLIAIADSKETVQVNGTTVGKFATRMTFSGNDVTLTYEDGTSQSADLSAVNIAFDYTAVFKEANYDNLATIKTFGGKSLSTEVTRTMASGQWSTICLPFNVPSSSIPSLFGNGTLIATLNNATEESINFVTVDEMTKGMPYLIKPANNVTSFTLANTLIGTMSEGSTIDAGLCQFTGSIENLGATLTCSGYNTTLKGDVNKDGQTTVADVTIMVDYILGIITQIDIDVADLTNDDDITVADITVLVNIILGSQAIDSQPTILIDGMASGLKLTDLD